MRIRARGQPYYSKKPCLQTQEWNRLNSIMKDQSRTGGNLYDKYHTRNPVARRLMDGFLRTFDELSSSVVFRTAFEVGCGEGHLSLRLARKGISVSGCDVSASVIDEARENARLTGLPADFQVRSVYDLGADGTKADLVVCCEVLEHLENPYRALEILTRLAGSYLLLSVPREPIWRVLNMARGSYWGSLGNTPGHLQHWSSTDFVSLLRGKVEVLEIRQPLPWTMVLCRTV